jgi:hypothetical protein
MAANSPTVITESKAGFVKGMGLMDATTLVMGSMIGSGIFIVSADVSRQVQSPGLLLVCWFLGALLTIIAALSYGELAAAMPHAGGQYVYLREAFGRLWGFLYGWTLFVVIQTGTIAAVHFGEELSDRIRLDWTDHTATSRDHRNHHPDPGEHARHPNRRTGAERLHVRQNRFTAESCCIRISARTESAGDRRELRSPLDHSIGRQD